MDKTIVISDKDSKGKDEVYWEFFKCSNCDCEEIIESFKYCPNCAYKLEWRLKKGFLSNEKVAIKTGDLAGISGKVYEYNRVTDKVKIKIDKNNIITVDYEDVIRK